MDAERFRALAERCRELSGDAVRDDIRQQLRQWAEEFEIEAELTAAALSRQQKARA